METHCIKTKIPDDGVIIIKGLPFTPGVEVEVKISEYKEDSNIERYPLRGKPFRYDNPFESVAENDWNVLK